MARFSKLLSIDPLLSINVYRRHALHAIKGRDGRLEPIGTLLLADEPSIKLKQHADYLAASQARTPRGEPLAGTVNR